MPKSAATSKLIEFSMGRRGSLCIDLVVFKAMPCIEALRLVLLGLFLVCEVQFLAELMPGPMAEGPKRTEPSWRLEELKL